MEKKGTNVTKFVEEYLRKRPLLKEFLSRGLINHSALAREIIEEAKKEGMELSLGAVKMAIFRTAENLKSRERGIERKLKRIVGESVIQVQSDLAIITVERGKLIGKLRELSRLMEDARFFQITQGVEIFNILVARERLPAAMEIIGEGNIIDITDGQSAIILISPEENIRTPGFIYLLTSVLSYNGINITQIISCHKDTVFVFERKDAIRAYDVLENFILGFRN